MGPQFGPEELFDLLGALGFARCRWKSRVANYGPRFGYDPRQNRANRRTMPLSHDVASRDMRLMRPYQVEGELETAFPGSAGKGSAFVRSNSRRLSSGCFCKFSPFHISKSKAKKVMALAFSAKF